MTCVLVFCDHVLSLYHACRAHASVVQSACRMPPLNNSINGSPFLLGDAAPYEPLTATPSITDKPPAAAGSVKLSRTEAIQRSKQLATQRLNAAVPAGMNLLESDFRGFVVECAAPLIVLCSLLTTKGLDQKYEHGCRSLIFPHFPVLAAVSLLAAAVAPPVACF